MLKAYELQYGQVVRKEKNGKWKELFFAYPYYHVRSSLQSGEFVALYKAYKFFNSIKI